MNKGQTPTSLIIILATASLIGVALIVLAIIFITGDNSADQPATVEDSPADISETADEASARILSEALPENWQSLSEEEKKGSNPYSCYGEDTINLNTGECTISGTDIQYIHISSHGPHDAVAGLTSDNLNYVTAVRNNATPEDVDVFYNHFQKSIGLQNRFEENGFVELARVENTPGGGSSTLGAPYTRSLSVFSYQDLVVDDDDYWFFRVRDNSRPIREYSVSARYTLAPFDGYVFATILYNPFDQGNPQTVFQSESDSQAIQIYTAGRDGNQLGQGCRLASDISLSIDDRLRNKDNGDAKFYGPNLNQNILLGVLTSGNELNDSFREGELNDSFRNVILNLLFQKTGIEYPQDQKYDFKFKFYKHNNKNDLDFSPYNESDLLTTVDFNECI